MIKRALKSRKGFTLIELLVVVAIIALLISILLPSLRDAREQAKIAKCLSNLRGMSSAIFMYMQDNNDGFPFYCVPPNYNGIIESSHAGKTSADRWKTGPPGSAGAFYLRIEDRPLNPYLMGGKVEKDLMDGTTIVKRTEVFPAMCPSDKISHQYNWDDKTKVDGDPVSSYEDVGSSYLWNYWSLYNTSWEATTNPWDNQCAGWQLLGKKLIADCQRGGGTSTLTFLMEDPFLYALHWEDGGILTMGNHGKFSKHSAGYLDGHADYAHRDTRVYCGVGWNSINPNWVQQVGQKKPPIYYLQATRNCNPYKD